MNKAILVGRLTADPDIRTTQSGKTVAQFKLAIDRRFKNKDGTRDTDFLPIVVWGQQADFVRQYASKGRRCGVVGTIQTRSYEAQDGSKRYVTEVIAEEVELMDGGKPAEGAQKPAEHPAPQPGVPE